MRHFKFRHLLLLLLLLPLCVPAQVISNIDMDAIKAATQSKSSPHHYAKLVKRLQKFDPELSAEDYTMLYYGHVYADTYSPYAMPEDDLVDLFREKKFEEATKVGKKLFATDPVNIRLIRYLALSHKRLDQTEECNRLLRHYRGLVQAIYDSGDGASIETAMVVTCALDEYDLMGYLGVSSISQTLIGHTDLQEINPEGQQLAEGESPIAELYFDVQLPFAALARELEGK